MFYHRTNLKGDKSGDGTTSLPLKKMQVLLEKLVRLRKAL